MITGFFLKVNAFFTDHRSDLFIAFLVVLTGTASFALGRLSRGGPTPYPVRFEEANALAGVPITVAPVAASHARDGEAVVQSGAYVASKNGATFHLPTCPGAKRIKEENKRWFSTKEDAVRAGYRPAANCPGI